MLQSGTIEVRLAEAGIENAAREAALLTDASGGDAERLEALLARRTQGEPLELLLGRVNFLGVEMDVAPGVLVPRPETEILGRAALDVIARECLQAPRVIDMCCGAGNLGLAIAAHVPSAHVWSADLTDAAERTTRHNAERLGLADRVTVSRGDLFGALEPHALAGTIDVIVCNPPYISTSRLAADRAELLRFEPREAFDAGPYGLRIHQRLIAEAPTYLRPGGWLLCEFGLGQERQLQLLFDRAKRYGAVSFAQDERGAPRVAIARRTS